MRFSLRTLLVGFAVVLASSFALAGVAGADDSNPYVSGETVTKTTALTPQVEAATATKNESAAQKAAGSLAFTGRDVTEVAVFGGALLIAGVGFLLVRRRVAHSA
jgi:LPXTG-motif cell wall-anchored protein